MPVLRMKLLLVLLPLLSLLLVTVWCLMVAAGCLLIGCPLLVGAGCCWPLRGARAAPVVPGFFVAAAFVAAAVCSCCCIQRQNQVQLQQQRTGTTITGITWSPKNQHGPNMGRGHEGIATNEKKQFQGIKITS